MNARTKEGRRKGLLKQCVGIDISKLSFSACVAQIDVEQEVRRSEVREFANTKKGFNQLVKWASKQIDQSVPIVYLMEATGVYYESLAYHLEKINKCVHVVLPNKAKHYLSSLNWKTKTDRVDARGLAQFGVERKFSAWHPPREVYRRLKAVTRHRTSLQEIKVGLMNRLSASQSSEVSDKMIVRSIKKMIGALEQQVDKCEQEVKLIIKSDAPLEGKMKKLMSITGVGLVSAAVVVGETGGFELFRSIKQLISFAGLDVVQRQSGTSLQGKSRISKKGNSHIRRVLYFPALSAVQHNALFKRIYQGHLLNDKKKKVALVAIQRKLLALLYTLWKKDCFFIADYATERTKKIAPVYTEATQDS